MKNRLGTLLTHIHWLDFCCLLFGIVLLSEFFTLLQSGFFNAAGMHDRLSILSEQTKNPFSLQFLLCVDTYRSILAPLCGIVLLVTSVGLCLLIARTWLMYCTTVVFLMYSFAHLSSQATWLFEYLLVFYLALAISLGKTADLFLKHQLLGFKLFNSSRKFPKFIFLSLSTALLFACLLLAKNAGNASFRVAVLTSASYFVLLTLSLFLEHFRSTGETYRQKIEILKFRRPFFYNLHRIDWVDVMAVMIGAMLVFQIYENHMLGWFTVAGYKDLLATFRDQSNAPYITGILNYVIRHAEVFMPIQMAVETTLSITLVTQLFRFYAPLATFFLFLGLTYVEFGVPASWPANASTEVTWVWELLLSTTIIFMITVYQLGQSLNAKSTKEALLGTRLFENTHLAFRFFIALAAGILLMLTILIGYEAKELGLILAVSSGLTVFFYIMILAVIDFYKPPEDA